jgi:hypothetical protein
MDEHITAPRGELQRLRARYDTTTMPPAAFAAAKDIEIERT